MNSTDLSLPAAGIRFGSQNILRPSKIRRFIVCGPHKVPAESLPHTYLFKSF